ncbi:MAG: hypothetical protein GF320_16610 [Armatimonadia bacterium]|nr:hypothetical protein [Armatimonadia bacterium]
MAMERNLIGRATAFPSSVRHAATVVAEVTAGAHARPPTPVHYHVLLDASGSMYASLLPADERARFVQLGLARDELEPATSDGASLWTVTGETRLQMAMANVHPMQTVVASLLLALDRLPPHADMSVTAFASEHRQLFESARASSGARDAVERLANRGWTDELGDDTHLGPPLEATWRAIVEAPAGTRHKVILIGDGRLDDRAEALRELSRLMATRCTILTMGIEDEAASTVLMQVADAAGGHYYPLKQPVDLAYAIGVDSEADDKLVTDSLELLMRPRGDLKLGGALQLDPVTRELGPRVTPGAGILIPAGPLRRQETRLFVLTLSVRDRTIVDYTKPLCSLTLRLGDAPAMTEEQTLDVTLDDGSTRFSDHARRAVLRAQAHMVQLAAEQAKAAGDLARAERSYLQLARLLESLQHTSLAESVLAQARDLGVRARTVPGAGPGTILVRGRGSTEE